MVNYKKCSLTIGVIQYSKELAVRLHTSSSQWSHTHHFFAISKMAYGCSSFVVMHLEHCLSITDYKQHAY